MKGIACLRGLCFAARLEQSFHRSLVGAGECGHVDLAVASDVRTDSAETRQSSDSFHVQFCHIIELRLYRPTAVQALSTAVFTAGSDGKRLPASERVRFANALIFMLGLDT